VALNMACTRRETGCEMGVGMELVEVERQGCCQLCFPGRTKANFASAGSMQSGTDLSGSLLFNRERIEAISRWVGGQEIEMGDRG
jgi:hypothetical protein